ncbi:MAG: helix-turn-helix domain-containing protein, partial [Pseudomonadota bacterium]|nr:helix-turn-helix domain-containing protein [Pseudomonadota bacterium]
MKEETIGGILVSWRKKQGIFIADCANELNAPIEYLDAIENNFFSEMPNNQYAYNLIIKYAKFIHIPDKDSKKIRNIAKQILKITDQNTASRSFYRIGRSILANIIF